MNKISIALIFSLILCLYGVRADVISPGQSLIIPAGLIIFIAIVVAVILAVIWLVKRSMKKQKANKKKK